MKTYIVIVAALALAACSVNRSGKAVNPDAEVWTVASEMVDCSGVGRQRCLLIKPQGEADWQFFYSPVSGFDYQPGYEYVISVIRTKADNPPMDASSFTYTLDKVISKERRNSENIPDTSHMFQ